jgi:hypothetical protein
VGEVRQRWHARSGFAANLQAFLPLGL